MSIFEEIQPGRRPAQDPIRLFADRYEASRDFAARLNDDPAPRAVVFYTALGGSGKTSLLRHFQDRCAYRLRPGEWREVSSYPDEQFVASLAQAPNAARVPTAYLDFGARPSGLNRPQEAFSALFMLKRQLARANVDTHRFDFAAITYLHKSGLDIGELIRELFPGGQLGLAADLADSLLNLPILKTGAAIYDIVNRRLDDVFTRRKLRRRVPGEVAAEILDLPPEPDLAEALPRYFAADLRDALRPEGRHERVVLLFDTYEAFDGEAVAERRTHVTDLSGPRWFRTLLGHLPLESGVVPIVAGRIPPRWSVAVRDPIPERFVDLRSLGALPTEFADWYLAEAGIDDAPLRAALIRYSSIAPGEAHPLLLGICADLVLSARSQGRQVDPGSFAQTPGLADRERELVARLLSWVAPELEGAIVAVSACRSFDERLFRSLAEQLDLHVTRPDFGRLVAFSFVTKLSDDGAYEVHRLLRRGLERAEPEAVRAAHLAAASYYAEMVSGGDLTARLEEIYHRGRLDPLAGIEMWRETMEHSLAIGRYDQCRSLVTLLAELEVPPGADRQSTVYLMGRAELGLGRWDDAEALLTELPAESPYALLLQADLAFVRGDLDRAAELADRAEDFAREPATRMAVLLRLAELQLFRGAFAAGLGLCAEGFSLADDANDQARWHNLRGELEFFSGDVEEAKVSFARADEALRTLPPERRNRELEAGLLQNAALVHDAEGDSTAAIEAMRASLAIRRDIGDSRGTAHGLHGLGVVTDRAADHAGAARLYEEAETAARNLGEGVLVAKIQRARAELALRDGRLDEAADLATAAAADFERRVIPYDVADSLRILARVHALREDDGPRVAVLDRIRAIVAKGDPLFRRYPDALPPGADAIRGALVGFAAGDALGVPWEGRAPADIDPERLTELPSREDWPSGATSDDTAQVLLVARTLADTPYERVHEVFLRRLSDELETIRGSGPSTRAAVAHFRETGQPPTEVTRNSNGAAMRMAPVGWAIPVCDADRRRDLAIRLARATHPSPESIGAACAVAAMASWAVEGAAVSVVIEAGVAEIAWYSEQEPAAAEALSVVARAAEGTWQPGPDGVGLAAGETLAAVVHVLRTNGTLADAVSLGGDTDTVAALVGGLLGGRLDLPWLDRVQLPDLGELPERLADLRRLAYRD